jgi:hypothetical protein
MSTNVRKHEFWDISGFLSVGIAEENETPSNCQLWVRSVLCNVVSLSLDVQALLGDSRKQERITKGLDSYYSRIKDER